jgi:hypothetical protein
MDRPQRAPKTSRFESVFVYCASTSIDLLVLQNLPFLKQQRERHDSESVCLPLAVNWAPAA